LAPQHDADSMRIRRFALSWKGRPSFNRVEQIRIELNDDAPSVRFHYRTVNPTTGAPAPVPRIGNQTLTAPPRCKNPPP
jgi:hypothetical protein